MTASQGKLSQEELGKLILEIMQRSDKPLQGADVLKQLPRPYKAPKTEIVAHLEALQQRGEIFPWGISRKLTQYATVPLEQQARVVILQLLAEPLPLAQIKTRAKKKLAGCPSAEAARLVSGTINELLDEGAVLKLPKAAERYQRKPTLADAIRQLREQFPGLDIDTIRAALPDGSTEEAPLSQRILDAIVAAEPRAREGALASIAQVRIRLVPPVPKKEFDAALLRLGREGVLSVHRFYGHLQVDEKERDELVFDEKETYYGGVTFQRH